MNVISIVLCIVILDQKIFALNSIVMRISSLKPTDPGKLNSINAVSHDGSKAFAGNDFGLSRSHLQNNGKQHLLLLRIKFPITNTSIFQ